MPTRRGVILLALALAFSAASARSDEIEYVSDYFSFVGRDAEGHVAFAFDANRGRDGEELQAEHFAVLHAEGIGWQTLSGTGDFANNSASLQSIPSSKFFGVSGTIESGVVIESEPNALRLACQPLATRLSRVHGGSSYRMTSGAARLAWRGRILEGRVIHEALHLRGSNRLARFEIGLLRNFQGLYLRLGEHGDLYLHRQAPAKYSALLGDLDGFVVVDNRTTPLEGARVHVTHHVWGYGVYRWPTGWEIRWQSPEGEALLRARLTEQHVVANWLVGGFAMGIATGTASIGEREVPYYGLVELIR